LGSDIRPSQFTIDFAYRNAVAANQQNVLAFLRPHVSPAELVQQQPRPRKPLPPSQPS
jgi:hypothetical protein